MNSLTELDPRLAPGSNNPPSALDGWWDAAKDLSAWMADHPAIVNEDDARDAKKLLDRARATCGEIEDERDALVRPLNEQVATINAQYKKVHNKVCERDPKKAGLLDKVVSQLTERLGLFIRAETARREAEAEVKRGVAEEAERLAREAEAKEREAIENARQGELGVDVTQVVVEADSRFSEFKKADREATRAERDARVRIGGGWGKSVGLRTVETLLLDDATAAIRAVGVSEGIRDAILSAARAYRKQHGTLPAGVSAKTERQI